MRFFFKLFLLITFFNLTNCSQQGPQAKLRIVDLQGNPRNIQMRTPELNMQALAAQGNLSEEKIKSQPRKADLPQETPIASNKYNNDFGASSIDAIKNTMQLPVDPQKNTSANAPEITEADILSAGATTQNQNSVIEYTLNKGNNPRSQGAPIADTTDITADVAISAKQKGIFVQTGSFSVLQHAKNSIAKIEKFASKASSIKIEEAQSQNKTVYRVLIGPFANKQKANAVVSKLTKAGHQAIIVKNK